MTTERDEFVKIGQELLKKHVEEGTLDAASYIIRMSSGTSASGPLLVIRKRTAVSSETHTVYERPAMCFASRNAQLWLIFCARYSTRPNQRILMLDVTRLQPGLEPLLTDFKPDGYRGIPNLIVRLAPFLSQQASEAAKHAIMTGERLTEQKLAALREMFPKSRLTCVYGASEIGIMGISCTCLKPNFYHPSQDTTVAVANPDHNGVGQVFITRDIGDTVIRDYRIGDDGRMEDAPCPCGDPVTFEILGRSAVDYVKVGGGLLRREELDRVIGLHKAHVDDWQAHTSEEITEGLVKGRIALRLYRRGGPVTEGLAKEIADDISGRLFLTSTRTLSQLVAEGAFFPLVVEFTGTPFPPPKNKDLKIFQSGS